MTARRSTRFGSLRRRWWSVQNWLKGYKFCAVRRFRCCDHTTPFHYQTCPHARRSS